MADDLVARLRAAIDEAERIARAAGAAWTLEGDRDELLLNFGTHTTSDIGFYDDDALRPAEVRHIVRHDPAAVLRRCAADRKILDLYADYREKVSVKAEDNDHWWHQAGEGAAYFRVLHLLAETYGIEP